MTNAIEELRKLLDERGVVHVDHYLSTTWRDKHGILHLAGEPMADGSLVVDMLTPEQAVVATLGGNECEQVFVDCNDGLLPPFTAYCSKCGNQWGFTPKYCPECGAKVVGTRDERTVR